MSVWIPEGLEGPGIPEKDRQDSDGMAQVDVLPLERFNAVWRPNEPERLTPVYVERVTIREALQGDLLPSLFGTVQLIEPTFGVQKPQPYMICSVLTEMAGCLWESLKLQSSASICEGHCLHLGDHIICPTVPRIHV